MTDLLNIKMEISRRVEGVGLGWYLGVIAGDGKMRRPSGSEDILGTKFYVDIFCFCLFVF